jgi:hypothetical protein
MPRTNRRKKAQKFPRGPRRAWLYGAAGDFRPALTFLCLLAASLICSAMGRLWSRTGATFENRIPGGVPVLRPNRHRLRLGRAFAGKTKTIGHVAPSAALARPVKFLQPMILS